MNSFAYIDINGVVREIIPPFIDDITNPESPREVPIGERYPAEYSARCQVIVPGTRVTEAGVEREVQQGDTFANGVFGPPPPPPPMSAAQAVAIRNGLLAGANLRKGALQDLVDIGEATAAETALLTSYKQYTGKLTRIEQQAGFPADVAWPVAPE